MSISRIRLASGAAAGALLALTAACSDDPASPDGPSASRTRADTLDTRVAGSASETRWVYVDLDTPGQPLSITDAVAASSGAWDVAFNGFATRSNPNASADVAVFCLCQNWQAAPTGTAAAAYFGAMTSVSELADFENVTTAQVPAATQFRADTLLGIGDWISTGTNGARTLAPNVYVLQRPDGLGFAKIEITAVQNASGNTPGRVTFRYATINAARTAFGATRTATVDVAADSRVRFNMDTGAPVTSGPWDVSFQGWRIGTNSGLGSQAGVASWGAYNATALLRVASFDALGPSSVSPTSNAYRPDGYGVFGERPTWYYDSANRTALPTYDVYLVRRGDDVYKIQVTGYRKQAGAEILANHVALRSARLGN